MENPYSTLEEQAFWSPAVAKRHMLDVTGLWRAPYPIHRTSRIATFGSCFAQHFSKALVAKHYSWLDAEPAPEGMAPEVASRFGYGVFSARTGNIYTTSLLLQWTKWALGHAVPPDITWEKDGRFYDPFRPAIEPDGFASPEEALTSRRSTIAAFRTALLNSNIFVFTLGLTESWWDRAGGFEYPMCPGTVAGTYDAAQHEFRNQDYSLVRRNLMEAIHLIREARQKGPRFLLTVSPVPLTATNSGKHVLVATMESKSILRAVAGNVAQSVAGISYFPSYEIINSPVFRGSFFEPNMRSVNQSGVNHVMQTFFAGLGEAEKAPQRSANTRPKRQPPARKSDDVVCEEELLTAFGDKA